MIVGLQLSFENETYAYQYAIGGMLKHGRHLVAYHSKSLLSLEMNQNNCD